MAPFRRAVACLLVLALCALAPTGIDAKKKRQSIAARAQMAPAPAPMRAVGIGRALMQGARIALANETSVLINHIADESALPAGEQQPAEAPAAASEQQPAEAPAPATEPVEPMEEGAEAPAPSEAQDSSKPAAPWAQCGGDDKWAGPTTCVDGTTCVQLSSTFSQARTASPAVALAADALASAQCVEIAQSRAYGCSARYAQCGGTDPGKATAWSGPYCCGETNECVKITDTFSKCAPCNAIYEQCGGTVPGTNLVWKDHGRPSCCAGDKPSSCKYVNNDYYQCQLL